MRFRNPCVNATAPRPGPVLKPLISCVDGLVEWRLVGQPNTVNGVHGRVRQRRCWRSYWLNATGPLRTFGFLPLSLTPAPNRIEPRGAAPRPLARQDGGIGSMTRRMPSWSVEKMSAASSQCQHRDAECELPKYLGWAPYSGRLRLTLGAVVGWFGGRMGAVDPAIMAGTLLPRTRVLARSLAWRPYGRPMWPMRRRL
jgi:hypothetical protein